MAIYDIHLRTAGMEASCHCREGNVLVNGTIGDAAINSTGDGDVYVIGTTGSVAVNISGDGDIKLRNAFGRARHSTPPPPPPVLPLPRHIHAMTPPDRA